MMVVLVRGLTGPAEGFFQDGAFDGLVGEANQPSVADRNLSWLSRVCCGESWNETTLFFIARTSSVAVGSQRHDSL